MGVNARVPWGVLAMLAVLAVLAVLAPSCSFEVENDGTRYRCTGGDCPLGYECVDRTCVAVGSGGDGGNQATDGAVAGCQTQYGDVADFSVCAEQTDQCEFFGDANGNTCDDLCAARGGTCINGFEADEGFACVRGAEDGCDAPHCHLICVCTLSSPAG